MPLTQGELRILNELSMSIISSEGYVGSERTGAPGYSWLGAGRLYKNAVKSLSRMGLITVMTKPSQTTAQYAVLARDIRAWRAAGWVHLTAAEVMEL